MIFEIYNFEQLFLFFVANIVNELLKKHALPITER